MKQILAAVLSLCLAQAAYAGIKIEKKPLKSVAKAALLAVTLDNIGAAGEANAKVLDGAVALALGKYGPGLKALGKWEMPDAPGVAELEAELSNMETSATALKVLDEMASQNRLPVADQKEMMALAMAALKGKKGDLETLKTKLIASNAKALQEEFRAMRGGLAWAKGLAGIPAFLLNEKQYASAGSAMSGGQRDTAKEKKAAVREIVVRIVRDYCAKHGLDAVALVHMASVPGTPGDVRVIVDGNRVLSSLKVNPTIVLVTKDGDLAVDAGTPRLDDLAPMKLGVALYTGEALPNNGFGNFKIDLADKGGKIAAAYADLIESTSADLLKDLAKKLK